MSRIGKLPVAIPDGVTVEISEDNVVTVKGPKGELTKALHPDMVIKAENGEVTVACPNGDVKNYNALWGLTRSLIYNMVIGVTNGYSKTLTMKGVGYRAALQGNKLVISAGYSHPVEMEPVDGITFEVPEQTKIVVKGIDKQLVGAIAADVRNVRPPEPYKGKGIRYEGEVVKIKAGKTGSK